jgi:hypothetical protein
MSLIGRESTRRLRADIATLYAKRGELMADLLQNLSSAQGLGDYRALDTRIQEHLTFEIVQLIANWDGANVVDPDVATDGDITGVLSSIVKLEEAISTLESRLPES